ncbi:MAG: hypothetical protein ACI9LS_002157, partial [Flavobacteriales bacterium]
MDFWYKKLKVRFVGLILIFKNKKINPIGKQH